MLKLAQPGSESFEHFKCGEIYFVAPNGFNVFCGLCESEMVVEQFVAHFQMQHLSLEDEVITMEVVENVSIDKSPDDNSVVDETYIDVDNPEYELVEVDDELECAPDTGIISIDDIKDDEDYEFLKESAAITTGEQQTFENVEKLEVTKDVASSTKSSESQDDEITEEIHLDPLDPKEEEDDVLVSTLEDDNTSDDDFVGFNETVDIEEESNTISFESLVEERQPEHDHEPDEANKEELAYACPHCSNSYHTKHGLQVHMRNVHNPDKPPKKSRTNKPPNKCPECNQIFRSSRDLQSHMFKHTGIFCDVCGRSFAQMAHLTRHKIRHSTKNFNCEVCNKAFFTAKEVKQHMFCHNNDVMPVICEICGKGCRNSTILNAHMRRHTGERPAKCEVCGKSFFSMHDLKVHAVAHTDERPFKCDTCGSTFQRKKALRVHKLIHSKNRKHKCKICGKSFAQTSGLNGHLRTHDAAVERITNSSAETFSSFVDMVLNNTTADSPESE